MATKPTYEELEQKVRKLELEAERRSEVKRTLDQQAQILYSIKDTIVIITPEMKTIYANQTAKDLFGDRPEMFTEPCYRFFKKRDMVCEDCPVLKTIQDEKPHNAIIKSYDRNGEEMWRFNTAFPFYDRDGQVIAGIEIVTDYTPQKRAEIALQKSEERFRTIYEESPIGIELYDGDGQLIHANKACLNIFGVSDIAEVKGFKLFDDPNISDEDRESLRKGRKVRYQVPFDFGKVKEYKLYETTESGIIHLDVQITPLGLGAGESTSSYLVQLVDMTDRKQGEYALRESEQELELTLDATTDGIWSWNFENEQMNFSDKYYEMLGYTVGEFEATYENWVNLIHPEDRESALAAAENYLKTQPDTLHNEFRLRTSSGNYLWIHAKARIVKRGPGGNALYMIGNHEDITSRKQAEQALRESEEKFKSLSRNAPDIVIV